MTTTSDDETQDVKVRAWELVTVEKHSIREAAAVMGVGKSTVARWVREMQQAEDFIDLLNAADVKVGQVHRLNEVVVLLQHRIFQEGRPPEQIVPVWLNVEKFIADLMGTRAPTRMQVDHGGSAAVTVDPRAIRAIERAKQRVAAEQDEIDGRGSDG